MRRAANRHAAGSGDGTVSPERQLSYLLSRLDHLLDSPDAASSRPSFSTAELQADLEASSLISRLELAGNEAAEALQKLSNKANALLTRREGRAAASLLAKPTSVTAGLILAVSLSRHASFDAEYGVSRNALAWTNASLAVLTAVSAETTSSVAHALATEPNLIHLALDLLSHELLTRPHAQEANRPDYSRTVVAPTVPKLVLAATACLEKLGAVEAAYGRCLELEAAKTGLLNALQAQLTLHPTTFRTHSAKLHSLSSALIRSDTSIASAPTESTSTSSQAALSLLCALHVTGAVAAPGAPAATDHRGKATQSSLWSASLRGPLTEVTNLWSVVASSYASTSGFQEAAKSLQLPDDELQALPTALARLEAVLGFAPRTSGRLASVLSQHSTAQVAVPLAEIISLATSMLEVTHESRARNHPPVDARTHAAQSAALYRIHTGALGLLLAAYNAVAPASPETLAAFGPDLVAVLLDVAEGSTVIATSSAAMRVLAAILNKDMAPVLLDPASPLVLRLANLAHSRIARLVRLPGSVTSAGGPSHEAAESGRKAKKPRLFESDGMAHSVGPESGDVAKLGEDETAAAIAGMQLCVATFPLLSTALTPAHGEAARSAVALLMALTELALVSVSLSRSAAAQISSTGLISLSLMLPYCAPGLLPLLLTRCSTLSSLALTGQRNSALIRATAHQLRDAVTATLARALPVLRTSDVEDLEQPRTEGRRAAVDLARQIESLQEEEGREMVAEEEMEDPREEEVEPRRKTPDVATKGKVEAAPAAPAAPVAAAPPSLVTFGAPAPASAPSTAQATAPPASEPVAPPSAAVRTPAPAVAPPAPTQPYEQAAADDDDDEDMPEIDLRGSDDESEGSEEGE